MAEVNHDGGAVDMCTDRLETALSALSATGTTALRKWEASRTKIFGLEARLGKGEMGAAFKENYNRNAESLVVSANLIGDHVNEFVIAGRDSVAFYVEADRKSKAGIPQA
jgi:hypothetical protein